MRIVYPPPLFLLSYFISLSSFFFACLACFCCHYRCTSILFSSTKFTSSSLYPCLTLPQLSIPSCTSPHHTSPNLTMPSHVSPSPLLSQIHTPKLIGGASEGGSNVFKLNYFDQPACLAQSPQLYKQMACACGGLDRLVEHTYFNYTVQCSAVQCSAVQSLSLWCSVVWF